MQKAKENNPDGTKVISLKHSISRPVRVLSSRDEMAKASWQALKEIDDLLKDHFNKEMMAK